jgi:hypothetical protein
VVAVVEEEEVEEEVEGPRDLVRDALLWLRPGPFEPPPEDALPLEDQCLEVVERPYPSLHTCLAANVVAAVSLLTEGIHSRFVRMGALPPVYLACAINFERDPESGELHSCEPAIGDHQEQSREEAARFAPVRQCLHPTHGSDWLAFFRAHFHLRQCYELWHGEDFVGNVEQRPPRLARGEACFPVYSLHRTTVEGFEGAARCSGARAGCVVAFRRGPPDAEPFGVWFLWLLVRGQLVVVDLQNTAMSGSLRESVQGLRWEEPPREEAFYAPMR